MRIKYRCEQVSLCFPLYLRLSLALRLLNTHTHTHMNKWLYHVWVSGNCSLLNVKESELHPE